MITINKTERKLNFSDAVCISGIFLDGEYTNTEVMTYIMGDKHENEVINEAINYYLKSGFIPQGFTLRTTPRIINRI